LHSRGKKIENPTLKITIIGNHDTLPLFERSLEVNKPSHHKKKVDASQERNLSAENPKTTRGDKAREAKADVWAYSSLLQLF